MDTNTTTSPTETVVNLNPLLEMLQEAADTSIPRSAGHVDASDLEIEFDADTYGGECTVTASVDDSTLSDMIEGYIEAAVEEMHISEDSLNASLEACNLKIVSGMAHTDSLAIANLDDLIVSQERSIVNSTDLPSTLTNVRALEAWIIRLDAFRQARALFN